MQQTSGGEELARPLGLEAEQREQLRIRTVELRHAEASPVVHGQIDATELEVARHVLQEVHELQAGAHVVARRDELGLGVQAQQTEHEPPHRICGMPAVLAQVVPGLVLRKTLVDPVRLDQPQERLTWKRELANRRLQRPHDGPGGLARVAGLDLLLELVERGEPIGCDAACRRRLGEGAGFACASAQRVCLEGPASAPFRWRASELVAEHVDQAGEAVDRAQVRPQAAWEEHRGNREVLGSGTAGHGGDIHP